MEENLVLDNQTTEETPVEETPVVEENSVVEDKPDCYKNKVEENPTEEDKPTGYKKKIEISEDEKKKKGVSVGAIIGKVIIYAVLAFFAIWTLFPILIGFLLSITEQAHYINNVSTVMPKKVNFSNYTDLLSFDYTKNPLSHEYQMFNGKRLPRIPIAFVWTCILVLPPTIIGLFTSAMSAFAFAKLNFKGKNLMFTLLLGTMMIPGTISLTPSYAIYRKLFGLGLWEAFPLFVPGMFGSAGCVFFLRQYFTGIPTDLMEAAKLDGMGYYAMFFKIIIPLSGAALIAQGIMGFVGGYNDYFGPLLYLANNPDLKTIQLILQAAKSLLADNPTVMLAAAMIALIPTLIIYIVAQRFFVEGIATSGMKL